MVGQRFRKPYAVVKRAEDGIQVGDLPTERKPPRRGVHSPGPLPDQDEGAGYAKLTAFEVQQIRALVGTATYEALGRVAGARS
jgi:hypothetical protein